MKKPSRMTVYLVASCAFLLAVNIVLGMVLTNQSAASMRTLIEKRMLDISNTAADMLDGDSLRDLRAEDVDTPAYQNALRTLKFFQDNIDLEYIYGIRDMGNRHFTFTVDPAEDPGEFGEDIRYTDALYQASLGTPAVDKKSYEDRWGRFYSAYSPVFDSEHRIVGIVGVDFDAAWFERQISNQVRTTLLISIGSFIAAIVIILLVAEGFRGRFRRALKEMNTVSDDISTLIREIAPAAEKEKPKERKEETPSGSNDVIEELGGRIRSLEDQLKDEIEFVRSQAYIDGLTGLGNRTAYEEHVKELNRSIREEMAQFSVVLVDMNGLKDINDRFGHDQGDRAIRSVVFVLKKVFSEAKIYRIGGDEFIVIPEGRNQDLVHRLVEFDMEFEQRADVSVSKGYAVFDYQKDKDFHDVFLRADSAMYEDKRMYYLTHKDRRRSGGARAGGIIEQ